MTYPKNIFSDPTTWLLPWQIETKGKGNEAKLTLSYTFKDWYHFQETMNDVKITWAGDASDRKEEGGYENWYGTKNWEENAQLLRTGWRKEIPEIKKFVDKFESEMLHGMNFSSFSYDTSGVGWDLDRFMSGEPECWMNPEVCSDKVQGAQIIMNLSASAGVDADTLRRRGAAVLALARVLEIASIPTEIWTATGIDSGWWGEKQGKDIPSRLVFKVPLKTAGEPFDYSRLSYGLVNPSMFRRSFFRLMEMVPDEVRKQIGIPGGYGMVEELKESELPSGSHVIYVPAIGYRYKGDKWDMPEKGEETAWIEKKLKLCGVRLRDI